MTKEERIAVYRNTVSIAKQGKYNTPSGKVVTINNEDAMINGTKFYCKQRSL